MAVGLANGRGAGGMVGKTARGGAVIDEDQAAVGGVLEDRRSAASVEVNLAPM